MRSSSGAELDSTFPAPDDPSASDGVRPIPEREITSRDSHCPTIESAQTTFNSIPVNHFSTPVTSAYSSGGSNVNAPAHGSDGLAVLDFSNLELVCPINVDEINNRWLNAYIPIPGQRLKEYPTNISAFIYRILKSYAAVAVRGRGIPPFVHSSQMLALAASPALSVCLSLVRICDKPLPGSEGVAFDVLQREMDKLCELLGTYDDMSLLAAFQAHLIYAMVLFFQLSQGSTPFLRQAMINLQSLACASSRCGLLCITEQQGSRPRWEAWIVAEAKRRTLYTMYLFDSVLSAQDGLPTFLGTELQGLPAPANKAMWEAGARHEWEKVYNVYLTEQTGGLRIDELWPVPAGLGESDLVERRDRVDRWLEGVDEFGIMLYAVTSCTHGG